MNRRTTSIRKIRYAVVGLGHIAQVAVLPAFRNARNSELVSIVSGEPEKREKLARKYRLEHVYSYDDYDHALSQVDAVYLALPNQLHRDYMIRAAQARVHVLCEKPMAVTEDDCQAMIDAADHNGVKLMIAYRLHFEAGKLEAIRLAENGKLGNLRIITSEFAQQVAEDNIRVSQSVARGGGPLYDMGVYCINAARYLFRAEPTEVFAITANNGEKRFRNVEEMTSVVMRFPEERIATFTCSFGATNISRYTLIGTEGLLTADPAYEYAMEIKHQLTIGGRTKTRTFPKRDQFAAELIYFSDCILQDKEPEPSGIEGLADVRIVQAIYESARTRRIVELPELPAKRRPTIRQEIHRPPHEKLRRSMRSRLLGKQRDLDSKSVRLEDGLDRKDSGHTMRPPGIQALCR
ncbi:MAG: gfo/Idh/MocA family oxidoreductase [Acidobacteria bacterium]|nr:MAG: gfo/Idh/MocA family oxidoreductase [Acidobacteriota bacterium]